MTRNEIGGAQVKGSSLATPEELSAKRILIAEDNAVNRLMIARQMKRLGLTADIVNNGADALTALDARNYDLLITDCAMPGVDGFELTATIREREIAGDRRLPIIALTADATGHQVDACFAAGMDGYLAKPVSLQELEKILHGHLDPTPRAHRGLQAFECAIKGAGAFACRRLVAAYERVFDGATDTAKLDRARRARRALVGPRAHISKTCQHVVDAVLETL